MQPTFLIIGAPRAGTTYLHQCLSEHPDVYTSVKKELNFFTDHWGQGLKWYQSFFDTHEGQRAVGEASVTYTATQEYAVAARIASILPAVKLVYLVRDPADRAWSHYLFMHRSMQAGEEPFRKVASELGCLEPGEYHRWIKLYLEHFRPEQLKVVVYEELTKDPALHLPPIFEHIGVDPAFVPPSMVEKINVSYEPKRKLLLRAYRRLVKTATYRTLATSRLRFRLQEALPERFARSGSVIRRLAGMTAPPGMPDDIRAWLRDYYREDVGRLETFLGRDLSAWR